MATGFAAKMDGKILVNTVSDTDRAAKVNWLLIYAHVVVTQYWNDAQINRGFETEAASRNTEVVPVSIDEPPLEGRALTMALMHGTEEPVPDDGADD